MKTIIGIDIGGSTTKIVGFSEDMKLIEPMSVRATDPLTSVYGAFGKFLSTNALELDDVEQVMITGVGSSYIDKPLYGRPCSHVGEFQCVGYGGIYLSGLKEAIIVSMGTGTSISHCAYPNDAMHPEFGAALREAAANGVQILAMDCRITPDSIKIDAPVEVVL